jgi:hypothetical protein
MARAADVVAGETVATSTEPPPPPIDPTADFAAGVFD